MKNEVHKTYIFERMGGLTKNYKFEVLFNDEVLVSNFDGDKSGLEYISNDIFIVDEQGSIIVNNYLNKELVKGDLFYRKSQIFDTIYRNYDSIKYIGIICGIAAVILFVYIMIIAGYNDKGELEEFWIDKIPYELLLTLEFVISYIFLAAYGSYDRIISYIVLIAFLSIWYLISINIFVSTLSRLKNRVFIKNTLIGEISRILAKMIKNIVLNMNSYPKAAMILAICFMGEIFIEIYAWATHIAFANFLWFIIKICQFIMLLYIFAMIVKLKNLIKNVYEGKIDNQESMEGMKGIFEESARYLNDISSGLEKAVAEKVKSEQLKTELITNVSHDIKTPLTSIINYIDLMNKEEIQNPKVKEYINVAYKQSIRLKKLTEDLIEASKAATGNIEAKLEKINVCEIISQSVGEYTDKFNESKLTIVFNNEKGEYLALADGRLLWRVIDNLFSNVCKYALNGTRLYVNIEDEQEYIVISIKNISKYQLNIPGNELMERFVRGDLSRNTSGNGLGLSIAKSLIELQKGQFCIDIDGDLYTAKIYLKRNYERKENNND